MTQPDFPAPTQPDSPAQPLQPAQPAEPQPLQPAAPAIRLVVIDDDSFILGSLQTILEAQPDIKVVATGNDGIAAEQLYQTYQPDILLTDIQMPNRSGLEAAEAILRTHPDARIVMLTTFADDDYIIRALRMGTRGYLIKQDVATIAPALRLVMSGQSVLGSEVLGKIDQIIMGIKPQVGETENDAAVGTAVDVAVGTAVDSANQDDLGQPAENHLFATLTARELEVTELVAQGLDNREIASTLYVSEGTVRNLISSILQKLELKNRTQLAVRFYQKG